MVHKHVKNIRIDDAFNLYVQYADGATRSVDLKTWIDGTSRITTDINFCKMAFIEHGCIISWPTGVSIDPELIYERGRIIGAFPL